MFLTLLNVYVFHFFLKILLPVKFSVFLKCISVFMLLCIYFNSIAHSEARAQKMRLQSLRQWNICSGEDH